MGNAGTGAGEVDAGGEADEADAGGEADEVDEDGENGQNNITLATMRVYIYIYIYINVLFEKASVQNPTRLTAR